MPLFLFYLQVRVMTACARGGVRFSTRVADRVRVSQLETREKEKARVGSLSRGPRGHAELARNGHLKRGRNGRGAPGVFLTRIPDVRASHLLSFLYLPDLPLLRLLLLFSSSPLPFGFLILPLLPSFRLFFFFWFVIILFFFSLKNYLARSCLYEIRILDKRIILLFLSRGFSKRELENVRGKVGI